MIKKAKFWILLFSIVMWLWSQIWWFSIGVVYGILSLIIDNKKWYQLLITKWYYKLYAGVKWFVIIILFAILLRTFFIEIYHIPSGSMEKTLTPGDIVVVEKATLGPVRPQSLLDLTNVGNILALNENVKKFCHANKLKKKRLASIRSVRKGDILVFRSPNADHIILIKRIVACPGDTLEIKRGNVVVNSDFELEKDNMVQEWNIQTTNIRRLYYILDSLGIEPLARHRENNNIIRLGITNKDVLKLTKGAAIDTLYRYYDIPTTGHGGIYPYDKSILTSLDKWGPIVIPQKGAEIELTPHNVLWYKKIITKHESHKLEAKNDSVFIDGHHALTYTFEKDYLFAMGDNRHLSFDCRFIGLVPMENVIGKARCVLLSFDENQEGWRSVNYKRTLKILE